MFEGHDPRAGKRVSMLQPSGELVDPGARLPILPDEQALRAYRTMVLARQADEWAVSLNRQGRMSTYVPNRGQEANSAGALLALRTDDWFVPAYRELAGLLVRDVPLRQVYLYWHGSETGSLLPPDRFFMTPMSVPVGSQAAHAVGIAFAERYRRSDRIVLTFLGEGATSEGDFHEACNLAGTWKAPVVIYVQNNQWAISVPRQKQTAAATVAEKAFAYGFEGVQVDGNDVFAVYAAVSLAVSKARAGGGPTLVEGYTYRMGPHTTADDPTRYRSEQEVQEWLPMDPLLRLERYLVARGLLSAEEARDLADQCMEWAKAEFEEAEKCGQPTLEDGFRFLFASMPPVLRAQLQRRKSA